MTRTPQLATDDGWPAKMDRPLNARYLTEVHYVPTRPKTLANWLAEGTGPKPIYRGMKPFYERKELDRWVAEEAWSSISPLKRRRQAKAEARP